MAKPKTDCNRVIPPRRTVHALDEHTSRIDNSLDLTPAKAATLRDLADARLDVLSAVHLIQEGVPCLIERERGVPHTMIYVPLRGGIEWRSDGQSWTVRPGQLIVCGAGRPQTALSLEKRFEVISIHAHIGLAAAAPDQQLFTEMAHDLPGAAGFWHAKLEMVSTIFHDPAFAEMTSSIVRLLLVELALNGAELTPYRRATDPRVKKAMTIIREQTGNTQILDEAAHAANVSSSHLRRLFKEQLGISPKAYQQDLRVREVLRLLGQPGVSLKEIAVRLGYANQQHLEKDFKKKFGVAPGRYREKMS